MRVARRCDAMHRRQPAIVRPAREQIAEVDQQRPVGRCHRVPAAIGSQDLEAGHLVRPQDGDDAVVGVRAHAHLALTDRHPRRDVVMVHPQHIDRVVGVRSEVCFRKAERRGEDRGHRVRDRSGPHEPGLHPGPERVGAIAGGPDVLGIHLGIQVEPRELRRRRADVERLEQVVRRHDAEAVAEPFRPRWRIATVDRRPRRDVLALVVERPSEEHIDRGCQPGDDVVGDAVADDLHEPDRPARLVDRRRDPGSRRAIAIGPRRHVDDRHDRVAHP